MANDDILIIKRKFPDAIKIKPFPKYGEHMYEVVFSDKIFKVGIKGNGAVIVPEK